MGAPVSHLLALPLAWMFTPDDPTQSYRVGVKVGEVLGLLIISLPAVLCLQKAIKTPWGSRRYAWLAAFMGLLFLCQIELLLGTRKSPGGVFISAVTRTLIGTVGGIFALRSLLVRGKDHQVGWMGPCVAGLLCVFHGLMGLSMLLLPVMTAVARPGESWVYQSNSDGYSLTLPTKRWTLANLKGASSAFRCADIGAQVGVFAVSETREVHLERVREAKEKQLPALRALKTEAGKTPAGDDYFLGEGVEVREDTEIRVWMFFVYLPVRNQTVFLIGEIRPTMSSHVGQSTQIAASEIGLRSIMMSIR